MENWSKEEVRDWLKSDCNFDENDCQRFIDQEVDGEVLASCSSVFEVIQMIPELKTGKAKKLLIRKTEFTMGLTTQGSVGAYSIARPFATSLGKTEYYEDTILVDEHLKPLQESGPEISNLLEPIREFKQFTSVSKENINNLLYQALRFCLACVNSRANGTIYFGIQDGTIKVVGCKLDLVSEEDLIDKLRQQIQNMFQKNQEKVTTVRHCIRNPKFIRISKTDKVIIEIDVESKFEFVRDQFFAVNISHLCDNSKKKRNDDDELFIRVASSSTGLKGKEKRHFIDKEVKRLSVMRQQVEARPLDHHQKSTNLRSMLGGEDPFNASIFTVLILDKLPTWDYDMARNLSFIGKYCKWRLVIDLNSNSILRDVYGEFHNTEHMTIDRFSDDSRQLESNQSITWWLYANGNDDIQTAAFCVDRWRRERGDEITTLKNQIKYLSPNRCLAVFLFFNDSEKIMPFIYERFNNFARTVYIAEYESGLEQLAAELSTATLAKQGGPKFIKGIIGLPWEHVENIFREVSGLANPECEITVSSGALIPVKRENWSDLDILGALDCNDVDGGNPGKYWKERYRLYCGNPASWLNFALSSDVRGKDRHVIRRREQHQKLEKLIKTRRVDGSKSSEVLTIHHHAGAGGSTLARHVLWDSRDSYKCAVIKSISPKTKTQIQEFYRYGEAGLPNVMLKPVLLVLDLPDDELCRIFLLEMEKKYQNTGLICIIIHCKRTTADSGSLWLFSPTSESVILVQKLSETEKFQFHEVLNSIPALEPHISMKMDVDHMLGFMAMIQDEPGDYVKKTITRHLSTSKDWEKQLLKFVALLNTYYGKEPDIPAAFFDYLIPDIHQSAVRSGKLDNSVSLFCTVSNTYSVHCFRIKMYPIFAKELLKQIRGDSQNLSDAVTEFLNCKGFKSYSFSSQHLTKVTTNMILKRRSFSANSKLFSDKPERFSNKPKLFTNKSKGSRTETSFSDLINDIYVEQRLIMSDEKKYSAALGVAKTAFETLVYRGWQKNPLLAQLIARILYLEEKQFKDAIIYAQEALKLCQQRPNDSNSFLLDTMGQIYKEMLKFDKFPKLISGYKTEIDLAREALVWFTSSIKANENENEINLSPYIAHVEMYKSIYEILQNTEKLFGSDGKRKIRDYLSIKEYIPEEIQFEWREHHEFLKELQTGCEAALTTTLDFLTKTKLVKAAQVQQRNYQKEIFIGRVLECHSIYMEFIENPGEIHTSKMDIGTRRAWNRKKVKQMGGLNFHTVMELGVQDDLGVSKLKDMKLLLEENINNPEYKVWKEDIEKLLHVSLSLAAGRVASDISRFEIYSLCIRHESAEGTRTSLYNLVMSMLLWPRKVMGMGITYNHERFERVLENLRAEGKRFRKGMTNDENELNYYSTTGRRKTNYKMRTVFYLSKRGQDHFVIYKEVIKQRDNWLPDDEFWADPGLEEMLYRLKGVIQGSTVMAFNEQMEKYNIAVPIAHMNSAHSQRNEELVEFYLGFTWEGPKAFGVGPIKPLKSNSPPNSTN